MPSLTTKPPPMVWFPDVQGSHCNQDLEANTSISTFQFIAFMLAAYNLVSVVTANANNNVNSNNVNSNSFNGNANNSGDINSNAEVNTLNMIVPGGRRKRQAASDAFDFISVWFKMLSTNPTPEMLCRINSQVMSRSLDGPTTLVLAEIAR